MMINYKNVVKHKLPTTHEEWLAGRLKGIGGSDAGAILGLNEYKSAYTLWCEKTGRISNSIDNEAMRLGRDLEDYVAKRFEEATGKKVRRSGYSYQSKDYPFMLANVDRLIVGEDAGLECKTANMLTRTRYDKGDIPANYYAQCMHYMAVTGLSKWYIAILVMNKGFYYFEVLRDDQEIKALIDEEQSFWEHVETDTEPYIDGSNSTAESLHELYPNSNNQTIDIFGHENELKRYFFVKEQIRKLESEKKEYENQFKHELGDAESGFISNYIVNWKGQTRNSVDVKKLQDKYPKVYDECLKKTSYRKFEIKEAK